jgi:hypothetical protein
MDWMEESVAEGYEVITCPHCAGTNVIPDHDWDGTYLGTAFCVPCDCEFIIPRGGRFKRWLISLANWRMKETHPNG